MINELTVNEVKSIKLIHEKIGKLPGEKQEALIKIAEDSKVFETDSGKKYLKNLKKYVTKEILEGSKKCNCLFCDWTVTETDKLICEDCQELLDERYKEEEFSEALEFIPLYYNSKEEENRTNTDSSSKSENAVKKVSQAGGEETKTTGMKLFRKIIVVITILLVIAAGAAFFMGYYTESMRSKAVGVKETSQADKPQEEAILNADLVNFIGEDYSMLKNLLGEDENLTASENVKIFPESFVNCLYDEVTGKVLYIDVDGQGTKSVSVCGLYYGMTEELLRAHMKEQNITAEPEISEDGGLNYQFGYNDRLIELKAIIKDDKAVVISCRMVQ